MDETPKFDYEYDISGEQPDPFELRPVQRDDGSGLWDALDASGHGHVLGVEYRGSVEIWLAGYHTGAEENQ